MLPVRRPKPVRHEMTAPGQLVHVDIKKLGRDPRWRRAPDAGVAYSEILGDERKESAAGFWERANAFFAGLGVTVAAVIPRPPPASKAPSPQTAFTT